ncbi:MAG: VanZ family protein [Christensenellales bacterium]
MFLPAGIYLPYYVKRIKTLKSCAATMLIILIFIELIQFLTRRGSFDIDDLILNMLGVVIGYMIWKIKFVQRLLKGDITANEQPST